MKFRKKPVVIEATQWFKNGDHPKVEMLEMGTVDKHPYVHTLEGWMRVSPGDWIITGVKGEFYPCKNYTFQLTYEPAE